MRGFPTSGGWPGARRASLPGLTACALAALLALARPASPAVEPAEPEEVVEIQTYLLDLYLGDTIDDIETIYPPVREWPSYVEPSAGVSRMKLQEESAKRFPAGVDILWLGMKRGRLVEIQVIYDAQYTGEKTAQELAADLALIYGRPRVTGSRFWWDDGDTVMRTWTVGVPVMRDGARATEFRTCLQLMRSDLLRRKRVYRH